MADPFFTPIVVSSLLQAGVSIIGGIFASNERQEAQDAMNRRLAEIAAKFNALEIPDIEKQKLMLEELKSVGLYTPELEKIIRLGPSAMEAIARNTELQGNQYEVLKKLDDIIEGGGLNKSDKSRLLDIADRQATKAAGIRGATAQKFRERGISGSGLEIAAALKGDQDAITSEAKNVRDLEARGEERALRSIIEKGNISKGLSDTEYSDDREKARAKDVIAQFNTRALQGLEQRKISERNRAKQHNLSNQQNIANKNVGIRNKQQQYNKQLIRQNYLDKLNKLKASLGFESTGATNQYNNAMSGANQTNNMWQAGANLVGNVGGYYQKKEDNKAYLDWLIENKGKY